MEPHTLAARAYLAASVLGLLAVAHLLASRNFDAAAAGALITVTRGWLAGLEKEAERRHANPCACRGALLADATFYAVAGVLHSASECGAATAERVGRVCA